MEFLPFDPDAEVTRTRRRLPHWSQDGRTHYVTFRLADSLPKKTRDVIKEERIEWLRFHGISTAEEVAMLPAPQRLQFRKRFTQRIETLLDQGLGSCSLRDGRNAGIVANALRHFDGIRYHLDEFVVMPNHVHLLVLPKPEYFISQILHSWKRHTAREINRRLNRTGTPLWLDERFDHLVRSAEHLERYRHYIRQNPVKARLTAGEYLSGCGAGFQPASYNPDVEAG